VPDGAPVGETTIDVDGDFTLGRPLDFKVTQSSAASAELDGPSFVYPKNGQTLDYEGAYLFKVKRIAGASGYLWAFFQGGEMVWENNRNEQKLSGTEYAIRPGTPAHKKFVKGKVAVWVRGLVNGKWTKATIITVHLQPKASPRRQTTRAKPNTPGEVVELYDWAGWSARDRNPPPKTYALGSWIVPHLDCFGSTVRISRAAMWVGLWGPLSEDGWLPQIGTQSQCAAGFENHFAVFQLFHDGGGTPPTKIDEISVKPGDRVTAEVVFTGETADGRLRFVLNLESADSEQRGDRRLVKRVVLTDADVLQENATLNGGCILENNPTGFSTRGLAKFPQPLKVEQCERDSQAVSMSDTRYDMVVKSGGKVRRQLATTGDIGPRGDFKITWLHWF
jgi:hypothetical protein